MTAERERQINRWLREFADEYLSDKCSYYTFRPLKDKCIFTFSYPGQAIIIDLPMEVADRFNRKEEFVNEIKVKMFAWMNRFYFEDVA